MGRRKESLWEDTSSFLQISGSFQFPLPARYCHGRVCVEETFTQKSSLTTPSGCTSNTKRCSHFMVSRYPPSRYWNGTRLPLSLMMVMTEKSMDSRWSYRMRATGQSTPSKTHPRNFG